MLELLYLPVEIAGYIVVHVNRDIETLKLTPVRIFAHLLSTFRQVCVKLDNYKCCLTCHL